MVVGAPSIAVVKRNLDQDILAKGRVAKNAKINLTDFVENGVDVSRYKKKLSVTLAGS